MSTVEAPQQAKLVAAIPLPISVNDLAKESKRLQRKYGEDLVMRQEDRCLLIATPGEGDPLGCWCHYCDDARRDMVSKTTGRFVPAFMIVCPECGNKRCPKANHHDHDCTGSNEPGQPGSAYPLLPAWIQPENSATEVKP